MSSRYQNTIEAQIYIYYMSPGDSWFPYSVHRGLCYLFLSQNGERMEKETSLWPLFYATTPEEQCLKMKLMIRLSLYVVGWEPEGLELCQGLWQPKGVNSVPAEREKVLTLYLLRSRRVYVNSAPGKNQNGASGGSRGGRSRTPLNFNRLFLPPPQNFIRML